MSKQLLFLEFNEVNFDSVSYYAARGRLPNLQRLIDQSGWSTTTSEQRYEHVEPWIQWVTAHTGLSLSEHGVFRLGDIVKSDLPQIWEELEQAGFKVGAISPMNARHRLRDPAFFVPDPWTATDVTASRTLSRLYRSIAQVVNNNAQARLTLGSATNLLTGAAAYARPRNYSRYWSFVYGAPSRPWRKAMFLDLLLADVFIHEVARTQPNFASLFLNSGAHIQHHYLFCSEAYRGPHRNPAWYIREGVDPVGEVYELYDYILGEVQHNFPDARLMLATGLHQVPHSEVTYYWRLKDHAAFLGKIGVEFTRVEPRMSRDFLVTCAGPESALRAAAKLEAAVALDGAPLFEVDNRGSDLFVMLVYPREITDDFEFVVAGERYAGLRQEVAFVALKNGEHDGVGYFIDSTQPKGALPCTFPLREIPTRIKEALGMATMVTADAA